MFSFAETSWRRVADRWRRHTVHAQRTQKIFRSRPEQAAIYAMLSLRRTRPADHIPPKGFFPPPKPSNLITVPCCEPCNASYARDDEAVRAWFSAPLGRSEAGEWIFEHKVVAGTVVQSAAFREKMLSTMKDTRLLTEVGEIEVTSFTVPSDRVERFLVRCTKGLLTHYYPDYDYLTAMFRVQHVTPRLDMLSKLEPVRNLLVYDERGRGVFQFRRGLTDSKQSGLWLFVFYGAVIFLVAHTKNNFGVAT